MSTNGGRIKWTPIAHRICPIILEVYELSQLGIRFSKELNKVDSRLIWRLPRSLSEKNF